MTAHRNPPTAGRCLGLVALSFAEPWLIRPLEFGALFETAWTPENGREATDEAVFRPTYDTPGPDGVAVLPVHGTITRRPGNWERAYLGAIGQDDIVRELARAEKDPSVRSLVLDIDSPGGHAIGCPEMASALAAFNKRKPVVSFTSGVMGSAAYFLAVGSEAIVATQSAQVGCIGTVLSFLDISGYYAREGVKREVIVNDGATFKGMGLPGTSLTDEQRAHLTEQVTLMGEEFKAAVRRARRVPDDAMRGQTLFGGAALKARLVDDIGDFGIAYETAAKLSRARPINLS